MARFSTLADWLSWQETLHPSLIELGLERVAEVWRCLHPEPPPFVVISVAGTNGKGSTVAMMEAILLSAGWRVGTYTSPHLLQYNERIRIQGKNIDDASLIRAFARIDELRGDTSLTYFEFGTLAALDIFYRSGLDGVILEVGLGGRLDAVNIIDADVAVVTTVALDHVQWLGNTLEAIASEKAGIFRSERPAVFGGTEVPSSLLTAAENLGTRLYCAGRDFHVRDDGQSGWGWQAQVDDRKYSLCDLPRPALHGDMQVQNAAMVLMALQLLAGRLPVSKQHVREGLQNVHLPGRFQVLPGEVPVILDVAHNPQAAMELAANLVARPVPGRTLAVLGMLADKDIQSTVAALQHQVDYWYLAGLQDVRGASEEYLAGILRGLNIPSTMYTCCTDVATALDAVRLEAKKGDRIVVCGSFHTVAGTLESISRSGQQDWTAG